LNILKSKDFWLQTVFFAFLFSAIFWLTGLANGAPVYPPRGAVIHHPSGSRVYNPPRRYTREQQQRYLLWKQLLKRQKPVVNNNTTVIHKHYHAPPAKPAARRTRTYNYTATTWNPYLDGGNGAYIINPYVEQQ
jgi:hypothetical protein